MVVYLELRMRNNTSVPLLQPHVMPKTEQSQSCCASPCGVPRHKRVSYSRTSFYTWSILVGIVVTVAAGLKNYGCDGKGMIKIGTD